MPFAIGFVAVLFGAYWDDGWHTVRGRDSFLVAPHIVLYMGTMLASLTISAWAMLLIRSEGVRTALRRPAVVLGLLGTVVMLISAPIDEWWHTAFGRDAVAWSPPHMLGVVGLFVLAASVTLEVSRSARGVGKLMTVIAGAALIGAATAPVFEYETDVPQFDELWYLPVLVLGAALAMALLRSVATWRYAVFAAAALYTIFRAIDGAVLEATGYVFPLVPLLVVPALIVEHASARDWGRGGKALAFAGSIYAAYLPYLNWVVPGVSLDLADVAVGLPLATVAAYTCFLLVDRDRLRGIGRPTLATAAALSAVLALLLLAQAAPPALAHDPGQGSELGQAQLVGAVRDGEATLSVAPETADLCNSLEPIGIVARRAGETLRAPLAETGSCIFTGSISLPGEGRWFVYGEFESGEGRTVEAWLPLTTPENPRDEEVRSVYSPPVVESSGVKLASGIALYAIIAALLIAVVGMFRRQSGSRS